MSQWYLAVGGRKLGPFSMGEIIARFEEEGPPDKALVWREGMPNWAPVKTLPEFRRAWDRPKKIYPEFPRAHEIDYEIYGEEMQFVEIELDPGESAVAEAGSMMYMNNDISLETVFGDTGSKSSGDFLDKLVGAGKRLLTGESLFMTVFTNNGSGKQKVAFGAPYPGKIIPMDLKKHEGRLICQKDAFLCAAKGVSIGIELQKKIGVGLFGGEGFIMQKLEGDGLVFVHAGGSVVERTLTEGQSLKVDTGCIVAIQSTINYDIRYVGNIKSAIFGGEGFFYAHLTGPGKIWLQSLPFSRLSGRIYAAAPQTRGGGKGEGSILGGIAGDFFRGD